jgi:predicted DNA-binding protein
MRRLSCAYHGLYHDTDMTTMLSLRLSSQQEKRLTALASRHGITRSEWLRNAIEKELTAAEAAADSHAIYLEVTAALADIPGSGRSDGARRHSRLLKQKLHASRHR